MSGRRPAAVRWLGLLALLGGCGDQAQSECARDADCGAASACVRSICVARAGAAGGHWAVEITPGPQSRFAGRELPDQALGAVPVDLPLDRKVSMMTELSGGPADGPPMATSVGVVLAVPSSIPGHGDLTFEAQGTSAGPASSYQLTLAIPAALLGRMGTLSVLPRAPLDRFICPFLLGIDLATNAAVMLPGGEDTVTVSGTLGQADPGAGVPVAYQARAFVLDRLVSNVDVVGSDGGFQLRLQRSVATAAAQPVRIELQPVDPTEPALQFVTTLPPGNRGLGNLTLPAYPEPAPFIVPVVDEETDRPVPGVTVMFDAVIEGAVGGQARYSQSAQTDAQGNAMLRLIPGTVRQTRDYLVRAIPPAHSESAARCLRAYAVAAVVTEAPRVGAPIKLSRRVALDGRVLRLNGRPAGSVRVRAIAEGDQAAGECGQPLSSAPPEVTSSPDGHYRLLLDPGQYRLEYEPAAGAPLPMATEAGVSLLVSRAHVYTLPPSVLVEGRVVSPDGDPVEAAEVKVHGRGPDGHALLRGGALSGPDGSVRLILPN